MQNLGFFLRFFENRAPEPFGHRNQHIYEQVFDRNHVETFEFKYMCVRVAL